MSDPDQERDLQRLRKAYRVRLQRDLTALESLLRAPRELEAALQLAHRLKGTSGSYGLDACSAALARIEERLEHLPDAAQPDSGPAWTEIEQALDQARAGLAQSDPPL